MASRTEGAIEKLERYSISSYLISTTFSNISKGTPDRKKIIFQVAAMIIFALGGIRSSLILILDNKIDVVLYFGDYLKILGISQFLLYTFIAGYSVAVIILRLIIMNYEYRHHELPFITDLEFMKDPDGPHGLTPGHFKIMQLVLTTMNRLYMYFVILVTGGSVMIRDDINSVE